MNWPKTACGKTILYSLSTLAAVGIAVAILMGIQIRSIQSQKEVIAAIYQARGKVEFHDERYPLPVWFQELIFEEPLAEVRVVEFDFEEHPDFTNFPFAKLTEFKQLEEIEFGVCGILGEDLVGLPELPHLKRAGLSHCPIGVKGCQLLSECNALEELNLANSDITDEGLELLSKITTLTSLAISLDDLSISDEGVKHLESLKNLKYLSLYGQPITDQALQSLGQLPLLEQLTLDRTKITGSGLHWLQTCSRLESLRLSDLPIDDNELKQLAPMKSLKTLILWNTDITGEGLIHLRGLNQLDSIWLRGTQVTPEQASEFYESMPSMSYYKL